MAKFVEKAKGLYKEIRTHWKEPAPGNYVPYKEYKDVIFAVGANYAGEKTIRTYIGFWAGCYLMMYHCKLPYLAYSIIGIINMPLGYIWTLIWWFVCDNLGFMQKKTERILYAIYFSLTAIGIAMIAINFTPMLNPTNSLVKYLNGLEGINCASAIKILGTHIFYNGYVGMRNIFWRKKLIPKYGRYKYSLYSDIVPKTIMVFLIGWLPFYKIPDVTTRVWVANLLFAIYNCYGFGNYLETCAENISPNPRERILVRTYPIKISHIFHSLIAIIIPAAIGAFRYEWADINVFRYLIPGVFLIFAVITVIYAPRIQERIPQPPLEKKVGIKFWDGLFGVLSNKYHWILTIVGLLDSLGNGMLAFTTILYLYTFRLSGLSYSLLVTLVAFTGTPPDFFTPYFIKRFSYKQVMIFFQLSRAIGYSLVILALVFCRDNVILCGTVCVIVLIFMEMTQTVPKSIDRDMAIRIRDYQMYISGERLESFAGIFGWFTGPITSFVSLIIPLLLLKFGFNSNWDVLFIDESRVNIVVIPILIDVIGFFLMTIPFLLWDYDAEKHRQVMAVLKRRAEVTEKQAIEEGDDISGSFTG